MSPRYIWHYTIDTGHGRESPRSEVADDIVAQVSAWLAADAFDVPMFPRTYRCVLTYRTEHCFEAELYSTAGALLVRMGFAGRGRCGAALWGRMVRRLRCKTHSRPQRHCLTCAIVVAENQQKKRPAEPWLAVKLGPGMAAEPDPGVWADFERCLAWAFLERSEAR